MIKVALAAAALLMQANAAHSILDYGGIASTEENTANAFTNAAAFT